MWGSAVIVSVVLDQLTRLNYFNTLLLVLAPGHFYYYLAFIFHQGEQTFSMRARYRDKTTIYNFMKLPNVRFGLTSRIGLSGPESLEARLGI